MNVSEDNSCNYPYQLVWSNTCAIDDPLSISSTNQLYVDAEFYRTGYNESIDGVENGKGEIEKSYHKLSRVFSFDLYINDYYFDILKVMTLHDMVQLVSVDGGTTYDLKNITLQEGDDDDEDLYIIRMSFEIKDSDVCVTACECGAYANAPYEDDCNDGEGGGDPSPDPCEDFDVNITKTVDTLYSSLVSPPVEGNTSYKWYLQSGVGGFRLISGTAENISLGDFGTYRLIVSKGGCQAQEDFLYQDPSPCNIDVSLSRTGDFGVVANVEDGSGSEVISWELIDENGNSSALPFSTASIVAQESGYYRVIVNDGVDCQAEDMIYIEVGQAQACSISASIIEQLGNDNITLQYFGIGNVQPQISWTIDRGDGVGPVAFGQGPTVNASESGHYEATITWGTCSETFGYTHIFCGEDFGCRDHNLTIQRSDNTLVALGMLECKTGFITTGSHIYLWEINQGNGWQTIGTANTQTINGNGLYRVTAYCSDEVPQVPGAQATACYQQAEFLVYDCDICSALDVTVTAVDDQLTAAATGCPSGSTTTYKWFFDDGTGETELPNTTATITAVTPGIYKAVATCGDCEGEAAILYTGCADCEEINTGSGNTYNVCT